MPDKPTKQGRRIRVKREPGIYYRVNVGGERRYQVIYRDSSGKQRWHTAGSLEDAKAFKDGLRGKKRTGVKIVSGSKETFESTARYWKINYRARWSPRTYADYELKLERVNPYIGHKRISDITVDDLQYLIAELSKKGLADKGLKARTIKNTLVAVSGVFEYALEKGYVGSNPVRSLKKHHFPKSDERDKRILDPDEITALLGAASSYRYRALLATAVHTGLRIMELLGLTWEDVDFEKGEIRVHAQLSRTPGAGRVGLKTGNGKREVVLMPALASLLREYKASTVYKDDSDYIFTTGTGKPMGWSNVVRNGLHAASKRAKLRSPQPTFHDLRHTFVSLLVAQGADVVFVSGQVGHSDAGFTLRTYAHLFNKAAHAEKTRGLLEAGYGNSLVTVASAPLPSRRKAEVVSLPLSPANEGEAASG
jgi:integrase